MFLFRSLTTGQLQARTPFIPVTDYRSVTGSHPFNAARTERRRREREPRNARPNPCLVCRARARSGERARRSRAARRIDSAHNTLAVTCVVNGDCGCVCSTSRAATSPRGTGNDPWLRTTRARLGASRHRTSARLQLKGVFVGLLVVGYAEKHTTRSVLATLRIGGVWPK